MDVEECNLEGRRNPLRIKVCEVCSKNDAKYTCPRCELRTCSLECVKIHKKELDCNGERDRVKFKFLKNFDNIDLLNDYRLLEEIGRVVTKPIKPAAKSVYNEINGCLPLELYRLKSAAHARGIQLYFLPPSFNRRLENTSYLNHATQSLYWRVEWVFPQADNTVFTDDQVLDTSPLSSCVHKYIDPEDKTYPSLSFYQAAGHSGIVLLLKAERIASKRYYQLDASLTLKENLDGKAVIEYPTIYVVMRDHLCGSFAIFTPDEEESLVKKRRRRQHTRNRSSDHFNNYLVSSRNDVEMKSEREHSREEDDADTSGPGPHKRFCNDYHNDRRGRHPYHFRGRWNHRRGRRGGRFRGRFHSRGTNNFADHINNGLSQTFGSVNIQSE